MFSIKFAPYGNLIKMDNVRRRWRKTRKGRKLYPKKMIAFYGSIQTKVWIVCSSRYCEEAKFNSFRKAKEFLKRNKNIKGIHIYCAYD